MNSKELHQLIKTVDIRSNNPVLPALASIKLTIKDGQVTLESTNLKQTRIVKVERKWDDIEVLIPSSIIETLSQISGEITLNLGEKGLTLGSKEGRYHSGVSDFSDFPSTPNVEGVSFSLDADYINGLHNVAKFASNDELRLAMTGVFFDVNNQLNCVATDAQKLIVSEFDLGVQNEMDFILPSSFLNSIKDKFVLDVKVTVGESHVEFFSGNTSYICLKIDFKYPNWRGVMPENKNEVKVVRADLISSLKRLRIFTNKTSNAVRLVISKNELKIKAYDLDFSTEGSETLTIESDIELTIGFNVSNVIMGLESFDTESVMLLMGDSETNPMLISDESQKVLVMPVVVN